MQYEAKAWRILQLPEVEAAFPGERAAGARRSGRQHAVEHVDARLDHLEHPFGVADAHEVARLVLRKERCHPVGRLEHRRAVLAEREPADRVAVEVELDELLGGAPAELGVRAALVDREAELTVGVGRVALPARPFGRAAHGFRDLSAVRRRRRHLVEAHRDVAAEVRLDLGGELGREARRRPVVDVPERDAVVVDGQQRVAERKDLEAAGVGEDRPLPRHEAM